MREKLEGEVVADVRRAIATTEVIKTMTFTVDRLSLLVWVWTVQSLRCAHFCDPKPAYVRPPEPNVFVFFNSSSSSSPVSLCFTNRSTKICHYMEFSSSA